MIGKTITHYKIIEKLGSGGMGVVYKAQDTKLDRFVALKFLPPHFSQDEEGKKRFIHEAKAASALDHPNICTIYEIDETADGQMFIAMAYYEGESVKKKIKQGPFPLEKAIDIAIAIANGLARAHEEDIVHRDIKPENIIITTRDEVKIIDFGLAKLAGRTVLTQQGTTLGTIAYMSPEQAQGAEVDRRTDIWSLGTVLYEMITGIQPFRGDYEQVVAYSIMNEEAEPLTSLRTGVPMELERLVNKTLEKDRELRYQSARDLLADFKKIEKQMESGETFVGKPKVIHKSKPRKRVLIPLAVVVVLLSVFLLLPTFFQEEVVVSSPKPIAVMPFENKTGDEQLDYLREVIPNLLISNLEQSRHLSLMTWERMRDLLRVMGREEQGVVEIDKDTGYELCKRDGIRAIILGSFTKAGDVFATEIKVLDVDTKEMLLGTTSKGNGVGSILESQIDNLSKAISGGVAIPSGKFKRAKFKVGKVTTTSMEAYKYYLEGVKDLSRYNQGGGIRNLEKAIQIDPSFAMAYYYLARVHRQIQNRNAAKAEIQKAMSHIDKTTPRERLYIEMQHASLVADDVEKATKINRELIQKFPKEKEAYFRLGLTYRDAGKTQEAIEVYKQALELDPNYAAVYNELGYRYLWVGEYRKAEKAFQKYAALTPGEPNAFDSLGESYFIMGRLDDAIVNFELAWELALEQVHNYWLSALVQLGYIYAIKGDYAEALRQYDTYFSLELHPDHKCIGLWNKARLSFLLGKYQDALNVLAEGITVAESSNNALHKAYAHELRSFIYAAKEDFIQAENELQLCLKTRLRTMPGNSLRSRVSYQCISGFFALLTGKIDAAKEKLNYLTERIQETEHWTVGIYAYWSALLDGEISLAEGNFHQAIDKFRNVRLPNPNLLSWRNLYLYRLPVVRDGLARAYMASGNPDKAISEYRRLLTFNPESKERFLIDPRHHYSLAKLYDEQGMSELAAQEYEKFLNIWKKADQDLEGMIHAKRRLAELRRVTEK